MTVVRNSYFFAVLLHIGAFGALALYTSRPTIVQTEPKEPAQATATGSPEAGGFTAEKAPFPTSELAGKLTASVVAAESWSDPEKLNVTGQYADRLESISSVSSMREMATYLRPTVAWKRPASQAEPGREKVFDHATSTPVGARQLKDGSYVFVFRDANNNRCELPAAPGDEHAARAMALLDRSDVLRELKESILLPMLNQRLDAP